MMTDDDAEPSEESGDRPPRIEEFVAGTPEAFIELTGHFYRGELERMTAWRTRLDQTTNWAVVLMAAILTFAFSSSDNPHYVLLLGALGVGAFLLIESQRYQEYDAWRYRVRVLQRNVFAGVFAPPETGDDPDWRAKLGSDLRQPRLLYPRWRAFAHRLRRVYFFLLSVLLIGWMLRISVFVTGATWQETASIASLSGHIVVAVVGMVYLALALLAAWSLYESQFREFSSAQLGDD